MNLHEIIGRDLAEKLTLRQAETIQAAADEAPDGLRRVAQEIRSGGDKIKSPVAVLLSRVKRGQHLDRDDTAGATRTRPTPIEAAHRLYTSRMTDTAHTHLDETERIHDAIDYAIGECMRHSTGLAPGKNILAIEDELLRRLGLPTRPPETPEDAFERRRHIGRAWTRITYCLHDPELRAMSHALREQCANPDRPTDDEAEHARLALIDEIEARDIQPRIQTSDTAGELTAVGAEYGLALEAWDADAPLPGGLNT